LYPCTTNASSHSRQHLRPCRLVSFPLRLTDLLHCHLTPPIERGARKNGSRYYTDGTAAGKNVAAGLERASSSSCSRCRLGLGCACPSFERIAGVGYVSTTVQSLQPHQHRRFSSSFHPVRIKVKTATASRWQIIERRATGQ